MTDSGQPRFAATAPELDPLGDAETEQAEGRKRNYAKVGSSRPSSLLYTYGPGAVMDLPQFTIMPSGLDDWNRIWARRDGVQTIHAPRLREVVAMMLRSPKVELRPFPWQAVAFSSSDEGRDLGVPARVFPQWVRCTGCDELGLISQFAYENRKRYRPDQARFFHEKCYGRFTSRKSKPTAQTAVPARYLLACTDGHLDEFPYDLWVHEGRTCPSGVQNPQLKMADRTSGKGAAATVECTQCNRKRPMNEAQGEAGAAKLPRCRGRHPHLGSFEADGCGNPTKLMLVGASNLWFAATQSVIVMPQTATEQTDDLAVRLWNAKGEKLAKYRDDLEMIRDLVEGQIDLLGIDDETLAKALDEALAPEEPEAEQEKRIRDWDPVDLLVPEWNYLQTDPLGLRHEDPESGLTLSKRDWDPGWLGGKVSRVLAVESLRKVNALLGFTRIDDMDRVGDLPQRLAPLTSDTKPAWTVATEDRGEGIFLQFDEQQITAWETKVRRTDAWRSHVEAHRRNFKNRFSETAERVNPDTRLKQPRYWLLHTFAHILIREFALTCGYSAASLSERIYAWPETADRAPAAGLVVLTAASDSDGTLGGLVQLSEPSRLREIIGKALYRASRCSSDPLCARRAPKDPEDFLHGAACHCCVMASETSCERANRFLERRFLVPLPGDHEGLAFFN